MAGAEVISRESSKMDATPSSSSKPHPRAPPGMHSNRRSISGGGDGGGAGIAHSRSHTMDSIRQLKSRGRGNNTNTSSAGRNKTNTNTATAAGGRDQNRQHYQHKHSRIVSTHNAKSFVSSNTHGLMGSSNRTGEADKQQQVSTLPSHDVNGTNDSKYTGCTNAINKTTESAEVHHSMQASKKSSRRTVSLPKAGSRLFGQNQQQQNATSSRIDANHKNNSSGGGNNNNTHCKTLISSATTYSHHLSDSHGAGSSVNNVFPPIPGGQVLASRFGLGEETSYLEAAVIKGEPTSLNSPRNFPGAVAFKRGGVLGPSTPTSPPEVSLTKLRLLSEPTFDGLHPRTPPILPPNSLVNGGTTRAAAGGNGSATKREGNATICTAPAGNGARNLSFSPDVGTSQQQPFSPGSSSERAKGKFEKKIQLSAVTEGSNTPQLPSPRGGKTNTGVDIAGATVTTNNNPNSSNTNNANTVAKDNKSKSKKENTKSLPKIGPQEEPFSIRRKIEQFRKWHEEQYIDKLKKFESDVIGGGPENQTNLSHTSAVRAGFPQTADGGLIDYAKMLEGKIAAGDTENSTENRGLFQNTVPQKTHLQHFGREPEAWNRKPQTTPITRAGGGTAETPGNAQNRPISAATWKTWRDVNTSDAYKDVKKYIRDNDLMDEEREAWIKSWIEDVEQAMGGTGDLATMTQRAK